MAINLNQLKEDVKDKMFFRNRRLQSRLPLAFPMVLNVELTNICTENCIWCPREAMTRPKGFMKFELFKKVIDEASGFPKLRKLFMHWMGEPLLHPEFMKFAEYAKNKDVAEAIEIATNGVALTEDKMKRMIELGIDELFISIDAATSEKYTSLKNTDNFRTIQENIDRAAKLKKALRAKLPFIRVKFLETDANIEQKKQFKDRWAGTADSVFFEKDLSVWNAKSEKVNKNIGQMECYRRNYGNLTKRYPCDRLWYLLAVHWDGKVSPCVCDWNGEDTIGDLNYQTIEELWRGDVLMKYRAHHINNEYNKISVCDVCTKWGTRNMGDWLLRHKERALSEPKMSKILNQL